MTNYVVWWTYRTNYSNPEIVDATNPWDAFDRAFKVYAEVDHPDFHKYAVEIADPAKFKEL